MKWQSKYAWPKHDQTTTRGVFLHEMQIGWCSDDQITRVNQKLDALIDTVGAIVDTLPPDTQRDIVALLGGWEEVKE